MQSDSTQRGGTLRTGSVRSAEEQGGRTPELSSEGFFVEGKSGVEYVYIYIPIASMYGIFSYMNG